MNVRWQDLAAVQDDLVARWQLLKRGMSVDDVDRLLAHPDWRGVVDGVHATNLAPITDRQRVRAATLTAPETFLAVASAADWWGIRRRRLDFIVVVRPGSGGPKRCGPILVCRSSRLAGNVTEHLGIPVTTAERTIIDLAAVSHEDVAAKATREAIRLKLTTPARLHQAVLAHRGARGTRVVRDLAVRYAPLSLQRSRSDAESAAQELIARAGLPAPQVNMRVAGFEADLVWPAHRLIVEIDGPQFHLFVDEDARRQSAWEAAGWTVRRISSDDVFLAPERLLAIVPGR